MTVKSKSAAFCLTIADGLFSLQTTLLSQFLTNSNAVLYAQINISNQKSGPKKPF